MRAQPDGHYLVSVSEDQTARLYAEWSHGAAAAARAAAATAARARWLPADPAGGGGGAARLVEMARPQVDLSLPFSLCLSLPLFSIYVTYNIVVLYVMYNIVRCASLFTVTRANSPPPNI